MTDHPANDAIRNLRTAAAAGTVVIAMIGLSYASVPLYDMFCRATGFGGTPQVAEMGPATQELATIVVHFDSNISKTLPWNFQPEKQQIKVAIGEVALARYEAQSKSLQETAGTAVFNVTPVAAGAYFNKIECFCFTEQVLKSGEKVSMPVQFFIDPAILDDPDTKNIKDITLSYTFYLAGEKAKSASLKQN